MASFAEIRAKMNSKYGDSEEEKKKQQEQKRQSTTASATSKSSFESVRSKMESKYNPANSVDESYINTFISDANKYLNSTQSDYNRMGVTTGSSVYLTRKKAADDLRKRSFVVRQYLEKNKTSVSSKDYDSLLSYLEDFDRASSQSIYDFYQAEKYYSQWDTEEDYNKYLQEQKEYENLVNFDIDAGEKEVKGLEALRDEYDRLIVRQSTADPESEANVRLREIRSQYGSKEDIEDLISEKNAYLNRAKHIQEGITLSGVVNNADFDANSGYVSTESTEKWLGFIPVDGMDETYEYINDVNGGRAAVNEKIAIKQAWGTISDDEIQRIRSYEHMTEDEVAIYNYYYSKDGKEAAEKYLDSIQETLNHRKATSMYENMEDKTLLELAFGVVAGLDQFESGVKNLLNTKDDYIPATSTQIASGMVREDLADDGPKLPDWLGGASLGQAAYDTVTTTANMAPSMLTSMAANMLVPGSGAFVGNTMMFASSAGNAYQEALNLGYDKSQARAYSTLVGASEAGLQYLLGGISSLGGKASGAALSKMLDGIDNAFARTALKLGGNMLSEGLEEGLQEVLTPLFKNWTLRAGEDINWSEVAYSGLLGALTAGFMEGGSTISGEVNTYRTGRHLQAADISAQRLAEIGKTFSADTVAYQLAGRVNENTGAYTMGILFNEIGATLSEQNVTEITNALVAKGMDTVTAKKNAEALAYVVEGGQLSEKQIAVIEANDVLSEVARTTLIDANTTWNQRSKGYNEALKALAEEMTSPKASRTKAAQQGEVNTPTSDTVDTQKENGTESLSEADGVDISPVKVQSISSVKNGQVTIKLEDGSEVDVKKADLDPDDGVRIETIASIEGISATDANFILNTLRTSTNASAQMDSLGAKEAYKYGFYGFSQEHMTTHGVFANSLTETQRQAIYEVGKNARQQQIESATPKKGTGTGRQTEIYFDAGNGNVEKFTDVKKMSTMTDKQKAGVQVAMILRKLGIGGDIYFFESYRNDKGQLVYKDKHGNEVKAPNGWYEQDGSIHIDLNAGAKGQGLVLFTLAHELTHFIEQWSPQKYKILADFLVENYEKGQSMDKLVRAKQARLSELRGKKVSYKEAYSEVVADSMEAMLADGNVMDKLLELKAKDNSLFMKMKQFFDNLLNKLRSIYKGQTPDSAEGRAVLEMTDSIEKIQQLFADALVDASENFQNAEKNTTQEGGVEEVAFSVRRTQKMTLKEQLSEYYSNKFKQSDSFYFGITPSNLSKSGLDAHPLAFGQDDFAKSTRKKHNIPRRVLNKLSENLANPIFSFTAGKQAAFVINDIDGDGKPVVVAIHGGHTMDRKPVNLIKSIYGIDSMKDWVETQINGGSMFRVYDIEKANALLQTQGYLAAVGATSDGFWDSISKNDPTVKNESAAGNNQASEQELTEAGIAVDSETDAGSIFSVRDVLDDTDRQKVAKALVDRFGVTEEEAMKWLTAETSLASLILNPKYSSYLDYAADPDEMAIKQNSDYPQGTVDFSNICKKRREFTQVMNRVLRNFPNHVFAATDLAKIRTIMGEEGMTLPCGICYVEDRRQLDTIVAQDFIDGLKLYREGSKTRPDGKPFNANQLKGLQLTDGDTYVPTIYELVSLEGRNSLKAKNPNMEAAWVRYNNARGMQSVRLLTNEAEYKRQILKYSKKTVQSKNDHGGLRIYSFSDAEMFHLIDIIQVITDSAAVGLYLQGYTKVNEYAKAVKDTGEKLNRSLIPLGNLGYHMENGEVVLDYDTVEGIDINSEDFFDNKDNPDIGNITIGVNDTQIRAAMVSDFVDQIIPFHTGQSEEVLGEKGIAAWENYKDFQTEKDLATGKTSSHQVNIYTEVIQAAEKEGKPIQNKRQFVEKFLQVCKENGLKPRFAQFLNMDAKGNYIYTEGYHKFLVDFKTFAQTKVGEYLPQGPVKPIFDDAYITDLLKDYVKEQQAKDAEVAEQMPRVIERIANEIIKPGESKYSDRDNAPTFYSQMAKVIDGVKQEKLGAASVVNMLRGKGVKAEEIKWSGIETFLEGKKSVTKAELQEFIAGSMLQIVEEQSDTSSVALRFKGNDTYKLYDSGGNVLDTFIFSEFMGGYISEKTDEIYTDYYEIEDAVREEYGNQSLPRWSDYKLRGGSNYREIVFRLPNSSFSNQAMRVHWGDDAEGVLAHARIQDFNTSMGKMLFIEEIQSDWHNEGAKSGYTDSKTEAKIDELKARADELLFKVEDYSTEMTGSAGEWETIEKTAKGVKLLREYREAQATYDSAMDEAVKRIPDAPFRNNYHEYVLKRLIREAAEQGYTRIGWTTAETQSRRWSEDYAEGYRIEYDQNIPKFLTKYGKKWGAGVGKTTVNGTDVWYMDITDPMQDSVLTEGQPLYQDRTDDSVSNRSLLANAFEGVAQNDIERQKIQEYKGKISLINSEEQKLSELNEKIKELSFSNGPKDTKAIRDLQFEARQTANRINTYDKQLLRLEASKPLQDVLTREKKMAYQRAEKKGKEALEAYREKAMKTQRELLDKWQTSRKKGIDSRHRTAMRHKIKDVVNELNQYLLKGTKDRHVPIELQKAVAEALDAVNMDTVGAEERIAKLQAELMKAKTPEQIQEISRKIAHIQEMGDKMNGKLKKLKDAYDQFVNSDDPLIANSHDEVISNKLQSVIETVGDTPLRDMTLSQLEDVYDMYRMVLTTIRNANKAFKAKKSESISTIANRVMMEVEKVGGKKKLTVKGMDGIKSFGWNNLKPVYAFEHIGSDAFTEVFNHVRDGEDVWAVDVTEAREFYLDKSKKHNYDSWDFKKQYKFTSTSGMDFELSLEQIMSLYAYSKRDQAADHLKKGGIVIDETTEITVKNKLGIPVKFNPTEATAYNISEETLADIISKLTKEQQSFVDEMQDYLSIVMGAKGNEVSLVMYGVKLFKEKFYFPLKSAQQFMAKAKEQQQGEVKIKNSGFSKETVQKASNPIVLTPFMNVWANHVNEMSMYHAFVLPMEDFYRVYNYKTPTSDTMATESVEMFIQNAYGKGATKYIDQLLKDLNGGARTDSTTGIINKMMGLFKKGAVFASLSVVVQQPSAIARAAALVDTKYFIGPKVDHKRHKALWDEVKQYAPVAIIKEMGYFDTNMGKSTQDFILGKEYSGFSDKMKALVTDSGYRDEVLSKAPALADELAWCSIWEAVKREIKAKNPGMDTKSEVFLKKAGERFTEVITKTQVYDSVLSRSALMRSKDTGMKMATSFMAEPTTSINMVADALLKGKRGNRKYARAAIGAVIASQILNSILVSFVYAGRDDDEDETYVEKYIGTLTGEILDSLNPAGYIPFIKDIMSIVQGYDVERSDMAVISDLWNAWQNLSKDNVSVYRKVEGFAGSISQIFGLPVKNIMRDVRGIYQTVMSFVNGQQTTKAGIGYAVKSALPKWVGGGDVSNQNQLYEAYLSGDKAQIARVEGRYEDQSAINSAIRKALRENDPRIHEAAEARAKGDISGYTRIAKEIIAEGHFSQDNVVAAINAEINAMNKGETTSSAPKASGLYKAEDFVTAISQGDSAMANAIKVDIIQTAQKNGKTEEEAEKSFASSAKSNLKELFLEGSISEEKAIDALTTYCDETQEDAEKRVGEWEFEDEYGFAYSDRGDAYKSGAISASELKDILMDVGGKTAEEANLQIQVYDWEKEVPGCDDITASAIQDYNENCAEAGISKSLYYEAWTSYKDTDGDYDANGDSIPYSKVRKVMPYIDSLDLTPAQKTALALCWWAESTVNKYRTW